MRAFTLNELAAIVSLTRPKPPVHAKILRNSARDGASKSRRVGLAGGNDCVGTRFHIRPAQSSLHPVRHGDAGYTADSERTRGRMENVRDGAPERLAAGLKSLRGHHILIIRHYSSVVAARAPIFPFAQFSAGMPGSSTAKAGS